MPEAPLVTYIRQHNEVRISLPIHDYPRNYGMNGFGIPCPMCAIGVNVSRGITSQCKNGHPIRTTQYDYTIKLKLIDFLTYVAYAEKTKEND